MRLKAMSEGYVKNLIKRLGNEQVRKRGLPPLMGEERAQATLPDLFSFLTTCSFQGMLFSKKAKLLL